MSKNFELLHNISNEKDLFQTLDGWEDTAEASVSAELGAGFDENALARTPQQSPLPDVFQAVEATLNPRDLVTPDLGRKAEPVQKPVNKPEKKNAQSETQSTNREGRFPISRNPITRLNSSLGISQTWFKPEIRPSPAKEEKTHDEPARPPAFRTTPWGEGQSIGQTGVRKGGPRSAYKDARREVLAHEEELKLVQRIFLGQEDSPRMVLFSGFERDNGCASICIRAAEILAAQAEGPVCLVDMGLRVPSLHEYCGVQNERGLAEALTDSPPIQEFAQQLSTANLWVIPSGRGASELNFAKIADRLRARMEELRKAFRFVVVHSGSLWLNADAMLISKWTDGVVLILEAHSTRRDTARRIKESLGAANARVLGVVLNNRTYPIPETLYNRR